VLFIPDLPAGELCPEPQIKGLPPFTIPLRTGYKKRVELPGALLLKTFFDDF
jgi:hypothetical protein